MRHWWVPSGKQLTVRDRGRLCMNALISEALIHSLKTLEVFVVVREEPTCMGGVLLRPSEPGDRGEHPRGFTVGTTPKYRVIYWSDLVSTDLQTAKWCTCKWYDTAVVKTRKGFEFKCCTIVGRAKYLKTVICGISCPTWQVWCRKSNKTRTKRSRGL